MSQIKRREPTAPIGPLTIDQLSHRTGEPVAKLATWHHCGLIGKEGEDVFQLDDIGRVRLIHQLLHYGHSLDDVREAIRDPNSVLGYFLDEMARALAQPMYTLAESAEIVGMDLETLKTLVDATGIADHDMLEEDDLTYLRSCKIALDAGYPLEALIQILRVYADAMRRAAEVGHRTSHFYMHQPAQRELPPDQVMGRLTATFDRIEPLIEPALLYFFRKGAMQSAWDDMLMHLEEESGLAEKPEIPGQIRQAVMFVDLASFTPLAEAMGDVKAAEVVARFAEMVRVANLRCHGRVVKQIGDGFMIVFPECYSAVSCALELEQRAAAETHFPAIRAGLHYGPVLYREGDYIGSNVNIASRLAGAANRHQVLVSAEVRNRARDLEGVEWIRVGMQRLKGLAAEVELFEARMSSVEAPDKVIDPVCGMELGLREVAARLSLNGVDHSFCSDDCLKQFVRAPEKYTPA
ncbi:MAG TPA: adenylate/guanylate cyclase domain-containing protein [Dehalococcoidia bacterium]|nr:adenylate/guanylate cyclase domain-containing protein [Dehalococcoidia bacterium]